MLFHSSTTGWSSTRKWFWRPAIRVYLRSGRCLTGSWNGERLFQAAKFGTEMQYQRLVFEEFARKIQPAVNTSSVPDGFDITLDPSIVAEFAHVVYRFGHSMLTESIDRFDPTFSEDHISLIQGFLNPLQFENNGAMRLSTPTSRRATSSAA